MVEISNCRFDEYPDEYPVPGFTSKSLVRIAVMDTALHYNSGDFDELRVQIIINELAAF